MKKIINLILVICAMLILVSCEDKDEVADEIVTYYNDEWSANNNRKDTKLRNIEDDLSKFDEANKTDEMAELYNNEIIPLADEVLKKFKSVDPPNKKVKKMNDMQIEAEEHFQETSKDVVTYNKGEDVSEKDLQEQENELIEKQGDILDYRDELMDKYDLEEVEDGKGRFPKIECAED